MISLEWYEFEKIWDKLNVNFRRSKKWTAIAKGKQSQTFVEYFEWRKKKVNKNSSKERNKNKQEIYLSLLFLKRSF